VRAEPTELSEVIIVHSPVFGDSRGFFTEVFHENEFERLGLPTHFAQDNHSRSAKNILRGLHFQLENPQGKLVHVVSGAIFDVAVDLRRSSANCGKWVGVTLEAGDGRHLWIPAGFGHAFLALSNTVEVYYKNTTVYHPESNRSIRWNDPDIGVRWPLRAGVEPLLSPKDAAAPAFASQTWFE
jgi:dTDP-4-dehydrorhamnose 3,5-epimerase